MAPCSYQLTDSIVDGEPLWFVRGLTCQPKSAPTIRDRAWKTKDLVEGGAVVEAIQKAGDAHNIDLGINPSRIVFEFSGHNWKEDSNGKAYLDSLRSRGRHNLAERLVGYTLDRWLGHLRRGAPFAKPATGSLLLGGGLLRGQGFGAGFRFGCAFGKLGRVGSL
jgi:hypothetical protein